MRHARLNTTEQYMAYAPRPELANQITRALDPHSLPENVVPIRPTILTTNTTLLKRLEEEIPAKWLREVERIFAEGNVDLAATESREPVLQSPQRMSRNSGVEADSGADDRPGRGNDRLA
jgi:hypothetical protein